MLIQPPHQLLLGNRGLRLLCMDGAGLAVLHDGNRAADHYSCD